MHVAVIGAGVVGVTSAYYLARAGCDVTLYEREPEAGNGTSFGNGGQLSYSFVDALAQPTLPRLLPGLLAGKDPAARIRLRHNPGIFRWGLQFLAECTTARAARNTAAVLELALESARALPALVADTGISFDWQRHGKLVLLPAGADLDRHERAAAAKRAQGCESRVLSMDEACRLEPALEYFTSHYAGAAWSPGDEHGDACRFTRALAAWLGDNRRIEFRFGTPVLAIEQAGGRVRGVRTGSGVEHADGVLLCAGTASRDLARPLGIHLPILRARGYSVSLPAGEHLPRVSISDPARRFVFCHLSGRLRIAGFADFVGARQDEDAARCETLLREAQKIAPRVAQYDCDDVRPWAGNRPMTPSGVPLIGATPIDGLFLNCGHGMLGWTLAAGSGVRAAQLLRPPR